MVGREIAEKHFAGEETNRLLQRLGRAAVPIGKQIRVVDTEVDPPRAGIVAAVIQHHRAGRSARAAVTVERLEQRNPPGLVVANHAGGGPARERLLQLGRPTCTTD